MDITGMLLLPSPLPISLSLSLTPLPRLPLSLLTSRCSSSCWHRGSQRCPTAAVTGAYMLPAGRAPLQPSWQRSALPPTAQWAAVGQTCLGRLCRGYVQPLCLHMTNSLSRFHTHFCVFLSFNIKTTHPHILFISFTLPHPQVAHEPLPLKAALTPLQPLVLPPTHTHGHTHTYVCPPPLFPFQMQSRGRGEPCI